MRRPFETLEQHANHTARNSLGGESARDNGAKCRWDEVVVQGDDRQARRLGISWAPKLDDALAMSRQASGGDSVASV